MLSTEAIYEKAVGLSSDWHDNFLELARSLRQLLDRDPDLFKKLVDKTPLGRRKAYYLVNISRWFDGAPVGKARLRALGWTKLQIVGPHVTETNAVELVELAENHTVAELKVLMKGEKPPRDAHCVLMYFSPKDFEIVAAALAKHGGKRTARGIINKEGALLSFIAAANKHAATG